LQVNIVVPQGPEQTLTIFEWYFPPGDAEIERAVAFGDEVQKEDIRLCEAVQIRLRSRTYDTGRFSVRRENGVHHFQGLVHEFLAGTGSGCS
jgi:choline monooxygenase